VLVGQAIAFHGQQLATRLSQDRRESTIVCPAACHMPAKHLQPPMNADEGVLFLISVHLRSSAAHYSFLFAASELLDGATPA
jgi:hypothetical protein